jgi:predicted SprT family Zn-dependent metalloprotease
VAGLCWLARDAAGRPSHFVIVVRTAPWDVMKDTLLHEWAHAIAWTEGHETTEDHGPEWGLAYSRVYQEIVDP